MRKAVMRTQRGRGRQRISLSTLISYYAGGGLFLLALLFGFALQRGLNAFLYDALHDKAGALARQLAIVSMDAVLTSDYGTLERYLQDLVQERDITFIRVRRDDHQVLGQAGPAGRGALGYNRTVEPLLLHGRPVGDVTVDYDTSRVDRLIILLTLAGVAAIFVVTLALFLILNLLLRRRFVEPIQQLAESIQPLQARRFSELVTPDQPAELARIAATFLRLQHAIDEHIGRVERANQAARTATQRLCQEQRLATVGQLAAGLAHGLNTPLANILGYAQMAEQEAPSPGLRERLGVIQKHATICRDIVNNLLTAARPPTPQGQRLELAERLAGIVQLTQPLLRDLGAAQVTLCGDRTVIAWADPGALDQVMFNLLSNAAQAGATAITLHLDHAPEGAIINVQDNGPGVSERLRATLFQPFVTSKPAGQGTGLGLHICATLLEAMGGAIELRDSGPGRTVFRLRLPAAPPQSEGHRSLIVERGQ